MPKQKEDLDGHDHARIPTGRLEAFSDGVMAVIITITVLSLKVPSGSSVNDISPLLPMVIVYLYSFQTVGTYWNNHHHLLEAADHVSAGIMWSNLHLLFWLSLIPWATEWLGNNMGKEWPTAIYSIILLMCGVAYQILQGNVLKHSAKRNELMREFRQSPKGMVSLACYILAVVMAFVFPPVSYGLIILVAIMWFLPDRRIEKHI